MDISAHEIHLWCVHNDSIQDPSLLAQYHTLLTDEEQLQQKRFYFEKHRHQYLLTRAMVRTVLSEYENKISPDKWTFEKNAYGKPSISNSELTLPLSFNISHSDELIVMAVTLDQEIGVDVEYLPRLGKTLDIANSFFSPIEIKQLFDLPVEKQKNRFFDLWTLKEAYIKACGMGLSIPLDHFSYSFSEQGKISIEFKPERNDQPEFWQFWQVNPSTIHKIALAVKSDKINTAYSVYIRTMVPLSTITEVDYPIAHGHLISM